MAGQTTSISKHLFSPCPYMWWSTKCQQSKKIGHYLWFSLRPSKQPFNYDMLILLKLSCCHLCLKQQKKSQQLRRRLGLVNTSATWAVCIGSFYTELRSALQKTLQILTGNIIWRKKKKNEDQNIHTGAMTNPKTEVDQTWCPGKLDPFIFECTHYDMQVSFPSRLT